VNKSGAIAASADCATDLFRNGVPLPIIQELLGHKDIKTTMIYVHVDEEMLKGIYNPLDKLKQKPSNIYEFKPTGT
jgi:integrase